MERPRRVLLASGNRGKLEEFRELLGRAGVQVVSPAEVGWREEVPETGFTLAENASAKARAGARATGLPTVADDTGLFVDRLGGAPGVRSARYAGEEANPAANCAKLLAALEGVPPGERGAEFRGEVALAAPDGRVRCFSGRCRGRITRGPRGAGGFGYDPLFEITSRALTFAEMSPEEKHRWSHRGKAIEALCAYLAALPEKEDA